MFILPAVEVVCLLSFGLVAGRGGSLLVVWLSFARSPVRLVAEATSCLLPCPLSNACICT